MFLADEIKAIMERDPAATTVVEALLYPSLHAVVLHKMSHALYKRNITFFPRLISQFGRFISGIEIHPGATIGKGLFIDHGTGVVIGETAELGENVTLYQGVTLGGTGKERGKRHPTLGNNVLVGVGAKVLGAINIGDNARIGANSVVLKDVPANTTAVGIPARVVAYREHPSDDNRRVEQLPDPEGDWMQALETRSDELEARVRQLVDNHTHEAALQDHNHTTIEQLQQHIHNLEGQLLRMERKLDKMPANQITMKPVYNYYTHEEAIGSGI